MRLTILTEIIAPYRIPVFNALARREEIDLHVVFLAETDASTRQWRIYTDEIQFSYEVLPSWRRRLGKYNLLLNQNVEEVLSRSRPEVVLCGGYNYLASWQAMRWARRRGVRFLLWCESTALDTRKEHGLVEFLKQKFLRNCDGFVVPGVSSREYMEQMGAPPERIFVAPNAVDIDLFAREAEAAHARSDRLRGELGLPARYFLFCGRLVSAKGIFDLLDAYATLPPGIRDEVGLVFAGDGPERAQLEAAARTIFPGTVHFAGFVHREQLGSYYELAECLVFPTHSDPWGLVVNEAMACGLPVICSEVAGCAADLVRGNGRLVAPKNVEQLAEAIENLISDADLRLRMSRASRSLTRRYSPESCAAGIAQAATGFAARRDLNRSHEPVYRAENLSRQSPP